MKTEKLLKLLENVDPEAELVSFGRENLINSIQKGYMRYINGNAHFMLEESFLSYTKEQQKEMLNNGWKKAVFF